MNGRRWWIAAVAAVGLTLSGCGSSAGSSDTPTPVALSVGAERQQVLAGFGVDGQPRNWGTDGRAVIPALRQLVDELGASLWRIEIDRGLSDWEQVNDDDDPQHFDWDVYDRIFSEDAQFEKLWAYVRELNALGIDDIELAAHGDVAAWMGGDTVDPAQYDEFVESEVALLIYVTERIPDPKPRFRWFSPFNEPNLERSTEGVGLDATAAAALVSRLAARLDAERSGHPALADLRLVVPEVSWSALTAPGDDANYRGAILADASSAAWIDALAHHAYPPDGEADFTDASPGEWLTETNGFTGGHGTCAPTTWDDALSLYDGTLDALRGGVEAVMVWTDYDAPHVHQNDEWQTYGLLETALPGIDLCATYRGHDVPDDALLDEATYTPKPTYAAFRHIAAHAPPGSTLVTVESDDDDVDIVAFVTPSGGLAVTGHNHHRHPIDLTINVPAGTNLPTTGVVSTATSWWQPATVTTVGTTATVSVPPGALFTVWCGG